MVCHMGSLGLHIFRRDLRLSDNTALRYALGHAQCVLPCFIFDPRQIGDQPYRSMSAIAFMTEALTDLVGQLEQKGGKLYFFYGKAEEVVAKLCAALPIGLVTCHRDYTAFSQKRDSALKEYLAPKGVELHIAADTLLNEPETVHKSDRKPYTVFTPFYRQASKLPVSLPQAVTNGGQYYTEEVALDGGKELLAQFTPPFNPQLALRGGTTAGRSLLARALKLVQYNDQRDYPSLAATSHLSAHHKFGTLSIREVYHAFSRAAIPALVRQLYWRDFFTHIAHHFPHIWSGAFYSKFDKIVWKNNPSDFERWCQGRTGFPIVDAGMQELRTTGYMHNRVRMITASFLIKDLHISWRWGERYFAQHLIDYDPAVNNGNWQWVASTGCDAQPYFRIFNPWRQQERFDPAAQYIKKWLPALQPFTPRQIHAIPKQNLPTASYPPPMVNHATAVTQTKMMYSML